MRTINNEELQKVLKERFELNIYGFLSPLDLSNCEIIDGDFTRYPVLNINLSYSILERPIFNSDYKKSLTVNMNFEGAKINNPIGSPVFVGCNFSLCQAVNLSLRTYFHKCTGISGDGAMARDFQEDHIEDVLGPSSEEMRLRETMQSLENTFFELSKLLSDAQKGEEEQRRAA